MSYYDEIAAEVVRSDSELARAINAPDAVDAHWFADRWLGSGTYATAYEVRWYREPAVLKLTLDVDECDVTEKSTEEEEPIRGLAYTYMVLWLDFEDAPHGFRNPNCMIVAEFANTSPVGWRADAMSACMHYLDRVDWPEDNNDLWTGLTQHLSKGQRDHAWVWVEDLRSGLSWIGDVPLPDTNDGNAGLVQRDGREMAVWVDLGQWG